jgi:NAD+ kinase
VKQIRRIGLVGNPEKPAFRGVIQKAARWIIQSGRRVYCDTATAGFARLHCHDYPTTAELARRVDLLIVFGGDGTMLRAAREIIGSHTPILGINIGGLGFLTAASAKDLTTALKRVLAGDFWLEPRALIKAAGRANGRPFRHHALNDFVISRGDIPRLIELEVRVNNQPLTRYRADGLIVSSPTGSTAYSLAAGGAVIVPTAEVVALTPICAHTLSNRSLIVSLDSAIQIKVISSRPSTILSGDGQVLNELAQGDSITIRRSPHTIRLVHLADGTFFDKLRAKLHWRGASL